MPKCKNCSHFQGSNKSFKVLCDIGRKFAHVDKEDDGTCDDFEQKEQIIPEIRAFSTGATRDTDANKPNYVKALSPIALQFYVEYLGKHRTLPDGSTRDWDNWKSGLPKEVCLESLGRHEMAIWLLMQGFPAKDNHGPVTLKDSLCGVIFNASCILHEILLEEIKRQTVEPTWISSNTVRYCPECEKRIAEAKDGDMIAMCEKCRHITSHVLKKEQK